ncbi:MAG: NAD(P)/FAD-dependent oxidoreductase [Hyphomicrobiales bacterium]
MVERDAVVVGAGFAGLYMLHKLRGLGLTCLVLEAGSGVGGTWFWNRYPGARCDVESFSYSYSFSEEIEQEWNWSHRYAMQPEILAYANFVADRLDLRRDISFGTRVTAAQYDEHQQHWLVDTGGEGSFRARFLIMATGCLSVPKAPDLPGLAHFRGDVLHTADWPREGYDFAGKHVGLIGTGSSGVQAIPIIARQAGHLTVFQRTPNFSIPAWNARLPESQRRQMKKDYRTLRTRARNSYAGDFADEYYLSILEMTPEEREKAFEERWREGGFNYQYAFRDLMDNSAANELAADFVRRKIRAIVRDEATAEKLCPLDHPIGTKRLCVDSEYYETYNLPNVALVDIKSDPITGFSVDALETRSTRYPLDTLVLATGFDAMTGALTAIDIRGRNRISLKDSWRDGAGAYLGLAVTGFPNMFVITGPGSPSVLANVILAIEQHVEWLGELLQYAMVHGISEIEADAAAQESWMEDVRDSADRTLYPQANSWYVGANVPGKPRVFMPYVNGFQVYEAACREVASAGYRGFRLARATEVAA